MSYLEINTRDHNAPVVQVNLRAMVLLVLLNHDLNRFGRLQLLE
jgi:hypothetical protein